MARRNGRNACLIDSTLMGDWSSNYLSYTLSPRRQRSDRIFCHVCQLRVRWHQRVDRSRARREGDIAQCEDTAWAEFEIDDGSAMQDISARHTGSRATMNTHRDGCFLDCLLLAPSNLLLSNLLLHLVLRCAQQKRQSCRLPMSSTTSPDPYSRHLPALINFI